MSRFVCWAVSQYILAVSGADIGITGRRCTGEFDVFGHGFKREGIGADEKTVGIQLRHPHHPVQPPAKICHEHRSAVRGAR